MSKYRQRVEALEAEGLTTSDAQGVADLEFAQANALELLAVLKAFPGFTDDALIGDPWIEQKHAAIDKAEGRE